MGIINSISNYFSTYWYLHPISHLNENGKVKPFNIYKQEVKNVLHKIYEEHEQKIEASQSGIIYRSISFLGKILSFNYSFKELINETKIFSSEISPIKHYDYDNNLKSKAQFKQDLKDKLGEIYDYHLELQKFENSNYVELAFNKLGKSFSEFLSLDLLNSSISLTSALFYGSAGIVDTVRKCNHLIKYKCPTDLQSQPHVQEIEMISYDMMSGISKNIVDLE